MRGYNFYATVDFVAETNLLWHLNGAAADQALSIVPEQENPLMRAVEHTKLARASLMAADMATARRNLDIAQHLLASAPQTEVTANYRLTVEAYSALVIGLA